MTHPDTIDAVDIELQARALRAAYFRQGIRSLVRRFRTSSAQPARA